LISEAKDAFVATGFIPEGSKFQAQAITWGHLYVKFQPRFASEDFQPQGLIAGVKAVVDDIPDGMAIDPQEAVAFAQAESLRHAAPLYTANDHESFLFARHYLPELCEAPAPGGFGR